MEPYNDKTDVEVLELAKKALLKASSLPPGSIQRTIAWAVFDGHMAELDRRAIDYVLERLGQAEE